MQDNHSRSRAGTVRGLHAQCRRPQGKLVRVVQGEIWDVAVDVRRGSPSFGRWVAETLSAENFAQLWIPPGFAHGFAVLSDEAEFVYKCTDYYDPADELRIAWNDPALAIPWPVAEPLLSEPDRRAPTLAELAERLPRWDAGLKILLTGAGGQLGLAVAARLHAGTRSWREPTPRSTSPTPRRSRPRSTRRGRSCC